MSAEHDCPASKAAVGRAVVSPPSPLADSSTIAWGPPLADDHPVPPPSPPVALAPGAWSSSLLKAASTPPSANADSPPGRRASPASQSNLQRDPDQKVRLRLMVALPTIMVLLLALMGGILFQLADRTFELNSVVTAAKSTTYARDFLIILAAFCTMGAVAGLLTARQIIAPIRRLLALSEQVARGDLQVPRAPVHNADEVGALHSSFNRMVDSLNSFFTSRNRMIVESFSGGLVTTDINGSILAINSAAERMLGVSGPHAIGSPVESVFARPDLRPLIELLQRALLQQSPAQREDLVLGLPGSEFHVTAHVSPMRDQQGQVHGLVLNLRDRKEFQRFMEEMSRADRLATLGTFSAGLAHEIRNPLGAIKGTAQLLAEITRDQPQLQNYVDIIVKEANRLNHLVQEVQEYSNPTSARTEPFDLNGLLSEAVTMARNHTGRATGVEILEDHARLPLIQGSRDRLMQCVLNVMVNALHATPAGGRVTVVTRYTPTQDYPVVVRIHNTGSSIPPEILRRIFEPFFTTKTAGSGLGLAIAHQVISHHGGRIEVANEIDGVAFTLRFPLPAGPMPDGAKAPSTGQ